MQAQHRTPLWDVQQFVQWVRQHAWGIIIGLAAAIASGPLSSLGNLLWNSAQKQFSVPLAVTVSLVVLAFVVLVYLWLYTRSFARSLEVQLAHLEHQYTDVQRRADAALGVANRLLALDSGLLRLLPGLGIAKGRPAAVNKVVQQFLHDACHVFDENVSRATILRPDAKGEYLTPWESYQMPQTSLAGRRFYIGPEKDKLRGIAGKAYFGREVHIVRIKRNEMGHWVADDHDYQVFDSMRAQAHSDPPYRSFVAIPILGEAHNCLGVLCFDSASPTAFDSNIEEVLLAISTRLAAIILLYQELTRRLGGRGVANP